MEQKDNTFSTGFNRLQTEISGAKLDATVAQSTNSTTSISSHSGEQLKPANVTGTTVAGPLRITCPVCGRYLRTPGSLKAHITKYHKDKNISCSVCDQKFSRSQLLVDHERRTQRCKLCDFKCCHARIFGKHMLEKHNQKVAPKLVKPRQDIICKECGITTRSEENMEKHMKKYHSSEPFSCSHCNQKFTEEKILKLHEFKIRTCEVCKFSCCTAELYHKHMSQIHNREIRPRIECKECKQTVLEEKLQEHINRVHLGGKRFMCDKCQYQTDNKLSFKDHVHRHLGLKPYKCSKCDYEATTRQRILVHEKGHLGEKHVCHVCGKNLVSLSSLRSHLNTVHNPDKVLKPKKKRKCSFCDFKCFSRKALRLHEQSLRHPTKLEVCHVCGKMYAKLKCHMKAVHKINYIPQSNLDELDEVESNEIIDNGTNETVQNESKKTKSIEVEVPGNKINDTLKTELEGEEKDGREMSENDSSEISDIESNEISESESIQDSEYESDASSEIEIASERSNQVLKSALKIEIAASSSNEHNETELNAIDESESSDYDDNDLNKIGSNKSRIHKKDKTTHQITKQKNKVKDEEFRCAVCQWTSKNKSSVLLHLIHHPNQTVDEQKIDVSVLKKFQIMK